MGSSAHFVNFEKRIGVPIDELVLAHIFSEHQMTLSSRWRDVVYVDGPEELEDSPRWDCCAIFYFAEEAVSVDFDRPHFDETSFPLLTHLILCLRLCMVPTWGDEVFVPKDFDWRTHLPEQYLGWTIHEIGEAADFQKIFCF